MHRPTYAEINLDAIRANLRAIRERVGPRVNIMPAVKANGYGHGAIEVSLAALEAGADMLGVASVEEALELRESGIAAPIHILGCAPDEAAGDIVRQDIHSTVCDKGFASALSRAAVEQQKTAVVHVKVDTGMGRIGVTCEMCEDLCGGMLSLPGIKTEGIFTHFPSSDEADPAFTRQQINIFSELIGSLRGQGFAIPCCHAANSGAILAHPESYFDMVRPGIMLYGIYPSTEVPRSVTIAPALSLKTRIVFLKEVPPGTSVSYGRTFTASRRTMVATIPAGYADGYSRRLSNRGRAQVKESIVPVIGRVCMDQTMLDVTDVPGVALGDEVTLYGGTGPISVVEVARELGTISYEVVCAISHRVPRVFAGAPLKN